MLTVRVFVVSHFGWCVFLCFFVRRFVCRRCVSWFLSVCAGCVVFVRRFFKGLWLMSCCFVFVFASCALMIAIGVVFSDEECLRLHVGVAVFVRVKGVRFCSCFAACGSSSCFKVDALRPFFLQACCKMAQGLSLF